MNDPETGAWVPALLEWYDRTRRALPWRMEHPDPYAVWVAEVMLQQTRTDTVRPYFQRWMRRFPTVQALAQATPEEVLALWEGLGYYRRALHLLEAARRIVREYQGRLPQDPETLQTLPGIGPYIARAIASIAYGRDVAVLDGNVKRVLARLFALDARIDRTAGERRLWDLAQTYLPRGRAAAYNQALMDLGATVCLPRNPRCPECPIRAWCRAYASGTPERWPRRAARRKTPHYTVVAGVIRRGEAVLLARRPEGGLLGGLWEFPGGKVEPGESLEQALVRELREELALEVKVGAAIGTYRHAYSHFRITLHALCAFVVRGAPAPQEGQRVVWAPLARLDEYPMGKVDRLIARTLQKQPHLCISGQRRSQENGAGNLPTPGETLQKASRSRSAKSPSGEMR